MEESSELTEFDKKMVRAYVNMDINKSFMIAEVFNSIT